MNIYIIVDFPPAEFHEPMIHKGFTTRAKANKFLKELKGEKPYENQYCEVKMVRVE